MDARTFLFEHDMHVLVCDESEASIFFLGKERKKKKTKLFVNRLLPFLCFACVSKSIEEITCCIALKVKKWRTKKQNRCVLD
jgi:hypothetical protein